MLLSDAEMMRIQLFTLPLVMHQYLYYAFVDVTPESYSVATTEWPDNSRSDMVHASSLIMIELQYHFKEFMLRLINYAPNGSMLRNFCSEQLEMGREMFFVDRGCCNYLFPASNTKFMATLAYFLALLMMNQYLNNIREIQR
ncbi:hypothetical protein BDF20DRAFT_985770 [Mycotypha africana]|uniref:uncharacterized protein n=1 Tax=Mycotypha africana TaxID=64632 RepID=UPI002300E1A4|nr:uncharacterized protein BDF20DRAFT_985770 [Mycotypha africana]KAI8988473.1 hypothetical protein BDF20DRAFT_985770 [Mycotypha africana]